MSTDTSSNSSDVQLLHAYLGKALADDKGEMTLDDALSGFQEYYQQLGHLRTKVRQAEESLARGERRPLDVLAVINRVRQRLAEQGIND